MDTIFVRGGNQLQGSVRIPGAKNSALVLMAAAMLCGETVTLTNVPRLSDVEVSLQILRGLGCAAGLQGGEAVICASQVCASSIPRHLMSAMRSSLFFLAPLLVRTGSVQMTAPGGCRLGARPIDIHLTGLCAMGAVLCEDADEVRVTAPRGLQGTDFTLRLPSVGATETLMMAAVGATGETILRGVAREPEIEDLAELLRGMGAQVQGEGTSCIRIQGGKALHGTSLAVCPDRIVAATVLCGVAGCGGEVWAEECNVGHLQALLPHLQSLGCTVIPRERFVYAFSRGPKHGLGWQETAVYPGLPTDAAPLLAAAALRAKGCTYLQDTVFENRFECAHGFEALGAQVSREGAALHIEGVSALQGAYMEARDLRGGAALVLGALQAQGLSEIGGLAFVRRGYEDIAALFSRLGAQIAYGAPKTVARVALEIG